jgi:AcrR family transcriptional regulator
VQIAMNASELFSTRGFHSVRMDDIANASGITARALYRHFVNKQALLSQVVLDDQQRVVDTLTRLNAKPANERTLDGNLAELADVALQGRRLSLLWQREARHLDIDDFHKVRSRTRWISEQFRNLLIVPERCDLDAAATELRSWAVVSIVSSPAFYDSALSRQRLSQELIAASKRVIASRTPKRVATTPDAATALDRRLGSRREQLMRAAALAFRHRGFGGVTIDEIGRDVGIVGAALYRYFDNKADILVALVTRLDEWQALELNRAMRSPCADEEVLAAIVQGYIRVVIEATDFLAVSLTERLYLPPDITDRFDRVRSDYIGEWQRWLSAARPEVPEALSATRVNIAKTIIDDCVRIAHLHRAPGFAEDLLGLVLAALDL